MAHAFRNEPDPADANRGRYALYVDGALVSVADWTVNGDAIAFPHTYTVPKHRGHGYAGELVDRAMDDVEQGGDKRVVPMCWFVGQWFEAHPERAGLLTR